MKKNNSKNTLRHLQEKTNDYKKHSKKQPENLMKVKGMSAAVSYSMNVITGMI